MLVGRSPFRLSNAGSDPFRNDFDLSITPFVLMKNFGQGTAR